MNQFLSNRKSFHIRHWTLYITGTIIVDPDLYTPWIRTFILPEYGPVSHWIRTFTVPGSGPLCSLDTDLYPTGSGPL